MMAAIIEKGDSMQGMLKRIAALAALVVLAGCAGTDFVRPGTDDLKLGKTTYKDVLAKMGAPRQEGAVLKNEKNVRSASYAYANTGGSPARPGVTPARAQNFYFYEDVLVGHEFVSSFAEDQSDFDESRVQGIVKGRTTRAQLAQLMGKAPSGAHVYPMIKSQKGEAAIYLYSQVTGSVFSMKFYRKLLTVTFEGDVVSDVEFTSQGNLE
jgi:hypothetical protein